jgi:hypothetical protein
MNNSSASKPPPPCHPVCAGDSASRARFPTRDFPKDRNRQRPTSPHDHRRRGILGWEVGSGSVAPRLSTVRAACNRAVIDMPDTMESMRLLLDESQSATANRPKLRSSALSKFHFFLCLVSTDPQDALRAIRSKSLTARSASSVSAYGKIVATLLPAARRLRISCEGSPVPVVQRPGAAKCPVPG